MAGCECEDFQRNLEIDNLRYEDGIWKRAYTRMPHRSEIFYKPIEDDRCPWCGSKLTEEAGTKDHFAGKVQDTLNEMAEEIPTEEAGDES